MQMDSDSKYHYDMVVNIVAEMVLEYLKAHADGTTNNTISRTNNTIEASPATGQADKPAA